MGLELAFFLAIGGLAVLFAVGMLLSENAVHSALFLIGNFGCVALLFLMLDAPFIGMVQIVVYTGAIMVLFLFVIMLLGAEQTTDTTRRFRWLTGSATALAIAFIAAIAIPMVISGGLVLPEGQPGMPQLRVVHGANLDHVNVTIMGDNLEEPLVIEDLAFGEASDFVEVPAGEYSVMLAQASSGTALMPPSMSPTITLEPGQVASALAYGTLDTNTGSFPEITLLPNDFGNTPDDEGRLVVFNAYDQERTLALVDLGADQRVTVVERDVRDEDGNVVYMERASESDPLVAQREIVIADPVIAADLTYGGEAVVATYPEGENYNLALVDMTNFDSYIQPNDPQGSVQDSIVMRINNYPITTATEQTFVIAAEPNLVADAAPRPTILDSGQTTLLIETLAGFGSPLAIGQILFTDYLLPVNLVGFLLLVALVGVIVLSRPAGLSPEQKRRRAVRRRVSRPLVNVISQQTGTDVLVDVPRLDQPESGD
ncbi:MAG: NADH-quinone oxidoreductase subunit J [Anaerolineae bacterium]|nr:NADH-quinone oxidoreductase subunit J [Anaerolineae bacterium]MCB9462028.1 NADH-quinone oxidoreductase subunit J [Anaerolineaceae bacterium]